MDRLSREWESISTRDNGVHQIYNFDTVDGGAARSQVSRGGEGLFLLLMKETGSYDCVYS
jgi:hypothetical protein